MIDPENLTILPYDFDRELIENCLESKNAGLRLYSHNNTFIVLGRGSDISIELNVDSVTQDQIPVYRRSGGGCSVVIDPGNLIISVVLPVPGLMETKTWFNACTNWMIDALQKAGIDGVYHDGISDLVIKNRKIAGSALYRRKDLIYYSVSILVSANLEKINRYLIHPPREPEYRNRRNHLDFLTTLSQSNQIRSPEALAHSLQPVLDLRNLWHDSERAR